MCGEYPTQMNTLRPSTAVEVHLAAARASARWRLVHKIVPSFCAALIRAAGEWAFAACAQGAAQKLGTISSTGCYRGGVGGRLALEGTAAALRRGEWAAAAGIEFRLAV